MSMQSSYVVFALSCLFLVVCLNIPLLLLFRSLKVCLESTHTASFSVQMVNKSFLFFLNALIC